MVSAKKEILDVKIIKAEQLKAVKNPTAQKTVSKPQPIRLSKEELGAAVSIAKSKIGKHVQAIAALKKALAKTAVKCLDDDLAGIVASLTTSYSSIKWSIKAAIHEHFTEASDWELERLMHGYRWFAITDDPVTMLAHWETARCG